LGESIFRHFPGGREGEAGKKRKRISRYQHLHRRGGSWPSSGEVDRGEKAEDQHINIAKRGALATGTEGARPPSKEGTGELRERGGRDRGAGVYLGESLILREISSS